MPDFMIDQEIETLAKAQALPRPEMRCDVLVIGAGPTGLACAIEAFTLGIRPGTAIPMASTIRNVAT